LAALSKARASGLFIHEIVTNSSGTSQIASRLAGQTNLVVSFCKFNGLGMPDFVFLVN